MKCDYCHRDPGAKPSNPALWNGFVDLDTMNYVCHSCRPLHYQSKSTTPHAGKFTERPVNMPVVSQLKLML